MRFGLPALGRYGGVMTSLDVRIRPLARHQLLGELLRAGVQMNDLARVLLETDAFADLRAADIAITVRRVSSLPGCGSGATLDALSSAVGAAGFGQCPLAVGAFLALDSEMEFTSPVVVISESVSDNPDYPRGFYVIDVRGERWLRGFVEDPDYRYGSDALVAVAEQKEVGA